MRDIPRADIVILIGHFNAKIGQGNDGLEHVMGTHALDQRNNNGELLIEHCVTHGLIIGGSIFAHKNIHKATWISPDGRTVNQIDHIMINKMWRGSLLDVKARRGADLANDHYLVIGAVRLKVAKNKIKANIQRRKRFAIEKLKNPEIKDAFNEKIKNTILKEDLQQCGSRSS